MKIFTLKYNSDNSTSPFKDVMIDSEDVLITNEYIDEIYELPTDISLDTTFYKDSNGFELTQFEIRNYLLHRSVWLHAAQSSFYSLIIEESAIATVSTSTFIRHLEKLPPDWDVYFPFDGLARRRNCDDATKFLLPAWGSEVYFITPKGAEKLLTGKVITKPVDEEVISRSALDVNLYYEDTGFFFIGQNQLLSQSRRRSIRNAIFGANNWCETSRTQISTLLRKLSKISRMADAPLVLSFGTLLGYVRHGGIMPWDDDLDLSIDARKLPLFLKLVAEDGSVRFDKYIFVTGNMVYYKFWLIDGQLIDGHLHTFPFVDLWVFSETTNSVVYLAQRSEFPKDIYLPFKTIHFEGSDLHIPYNPQGVLDISYPDWKEFIQVFTWSHREERRRFKPLRLRISVDVFGRLVE